MFKSAAAGMALPPSSAPTKVEPSSLEHCRSMLNKSAPSMCGKLSPISSATGVGVCAHDFIHYAAHGAALADSAASPTSTDTPSTMPRCPYGPGGRHQMHGAPCPCGIGSWYRCSLGCGYYHDDHDCATAVPIGGVASMAAADKLSATYMCASLAPFRRVTCV